MSRDAFAQALAERFGPNHSSLLTQSTNTLSQLEPQDPFQSPPQFNRSHTYAYNSSQSQHPNHHTSLTPSFHNMGKSNYLSPKKYQQNELSSPPPQQPPSSSLNSFENAIKDGKDNPFPSLHRNRSLSRGASSAGLVDDGPAHKRASPSPKSQSEKSKSFNLSLPPLNRRISSSAPPTSNPSSSSSVKELSPVVIIEQIREDPKLIQEKILIVDLRSYASYSQSRIPGAISICLPSTLLRRPAFSIDKIKSMIPDNNDRKRLENCQSASRIIVYDNDTSYVSEGLAGSSSSILGVLKKFENAGSKASLEYLVGGFSSYSHVTDAPIETEPKSSGNSGSQSGDSASKNYGFFVQPRHLPIAAFQNISTTNNRSTRGNSHSTNKLAANPFFDSVRQNRELANGMSQERIPLCISDESKYNSSKLPSFLRKLVQMSEKESSDELAHQFYRLEVSEQKRMMEVFEWLSNNSQTLDAHGRSSSTSLGSKEKDDKFLKGKERKIDRYSIGAGVELGHKNRYRNIYPFEHTRVKLKQIDDINGNDYVNASHVLPGLALSENNGYVPSPLYASPEPPVAAKYDGSNFESRRARKDMMYHTKRYIATQGPMDTTLNDFWQVCWEQDVRIIIMLTKQREGGLDKCCKYWSNNQLTNLQVSVDHVDGDEDENTTPVKRQSYVSSKSTDDKIEKQQYETTFVKRRIRLRNNEGSEKIVVQFQYLGWPDFDIPSQPEALLPLISAVNEIYDPFGGPILVHCSAGVGRTGSYVALDTILDLLRDERRKRSKKNDNDNEQMAVDMKLTKFDIETNKIVDGEVINADEIDLSKDHENNKKESSSNIYNKAEFPFGPPTPPPETRRLSRNSISDNEDVGQYLKNKNLKGNQSQHYYCKVIKGLHEPICDVVEDIREQRMSMVSTLRQYVYLHSAIIAGVLKEIEAEENNN